MPNNLFWNLKAALFISILHNFHFYPKNSYEIFHQRWNKGQLAIWNMKTMKVMSSLEVFVYFILQSYYLCFIVLTDIYMTCTFCWFSPLPLEINCIPMYPSKWSLMLIKSQQKRVKLWENINQKFKQNIQDESIIFVVQTKYPHASLLKKNFFVLLRKNWWSSSKNIILNYGCISGVTILLSLTIFLNTVSSIIPITSNSPLIGKLANIL